MRKRSSYRPRASTPPMLVNRGMINTELEMRERMTVEAFAGGWASTEHYDELADMRNVLTIAASERKDESALNIAQALSVVMNNIRQRYAATKRMGVTGDELILMREFVSAYKDFWMRQSVSMYLAACDALNRAHKMGIIGVIPEKTTV